MNAYTELKEQFDHLQKRTLQLFKYGQQREAILKEATAIACNQFERMEAVDNIHEMQEMASKAKYFLINAMQRYDNDGGQDG